MPQKIDISLEASIHLLEDNKFWSNCQFSIESSLKCFLDIGVDLPIQEYLFTIILADPASPYSIMNDNYCGDGGIVFNMKLKEKSQQVL